MSIHPHFTNKSECYFVKLTYIFFLLADTDEENEEDEGKSKRRRKASHDLKFRENTESEGEF